MPSISHKNVSQRGYVFTCVHLFVSWLAGQQDCKKNTYFRGNMDGGWVLAQNRPH